jgi:hypothetical protein
MMGGMNVKEVSLVCWFLQFVYVRNAQQLQAGLKRLGVLALGRISQNTTEAAFETQATSLILKSSHV